jgi:hypothetical protein
MTMNKNIFSRVLGAWFCVFVLSLFVGSICDAAPKKKTSGSNDYIGDVVKWEAVPEPVQKTVEKYATKDEVIKVGTTTKNGQTLYNILASVKGRAKMIIVTPQGTLKDYRDQESYVKRKKEQEDEIKQHGKDQFGDEM